MDHFAAHDAPGVRARQTGGKGTVFQDGIAVLATLLHQVCVTAALTAYHLVITFPDVGIFGVQVCPGFRTFQDDLIVVIVHIAQCIYRTNRIGSAFWLLLMQLNLVGLQTAVALINIDIAAESGIVRVISLGIIGGNSNRQVIGITLYQRAIVTWDAKHTLRGEVGRQPLLTIQGCTNHCGQEGGDTFFHTLYLLFRHQWLRLANAQRLSYSSSQCQR